MTLTPASVKQPFDVIIIGGGIAGLSASIHLMRGGLRVLCVDAEDTSAAPVGESLDWSAPELLGELGLPIQQLIEEGFGTWKKHVTLQNASGAIIRYFPGEWLGQPPFNIELRTLHVDRVRLNAAIRDIALREGVLLLSDRIAEVKTAGRSIRSLVTASGKTLYAKWFLDASGGSARLLPRTFNLSFTDYGPHKVAIWTYARNIPSCDGTTLHMADAPSQYIEWVWEVPIRDQVLSLGYVARGETIKALRASGNTTETILRCQLERLPGLQQWIKTHPDLSISARSYRCRVHRHVFGANWLVIGEAAAMVDPMTSNGVTAALRHAREAAALILRYRHRRRIPWLAAALYSRRVQDLARFFNCGIETIIYDRPVRGCVGISRAGRMYTVPAWSLNNLYSRFQAPGLFATITFCAVLGLCRLSARVLHFTCSLFHRFRETIQCVVLP